MFFDFFNSEFEISGNASGIDINKIYGGFVGKGETTFSGKGRFFKDPINVKYKFSNISFYENRKFLFKGDGKVYTDFNDFNISSSGEIHSLKHKSDFTFALSKKKDKYKGEYKFDISNIDFLMPWQNNIGKIIINGRLDSNAENEIKIQA